MTHGPTSTFVSVVWPSTLDFEELNPSAVFAEYEKVCAALSKASSPDSSMLLATARQMFDDDATRRQSIDSRAGLLLGAVGVAAALVTGVGLSSLASFSASLKPTEWLALAVYVVVVIFLGRTAVIVLGLHGTLIRHMLGPEDLMAENGQSGLDDERRIALELLADTIENYKANNVAMDRLSVAQQSFRNAVISLVGGGAVIPIIALIQ